MGIQQELRRVKEAVTPTLYSGVSAALRKGREVRTRTGQYLRDRMTRHSQPEMVYISVPGRILEDDIHLMVQAARSVYRSGRIPVCPYLMFPVEGAPMDTAGTNADQQMRFRLMDRCQTFLICGTRWTDEMWAEVNHAITRGMEVQTDQGTGGRPAARIRIPALRGGRKAS